MDSNQDNGGKYQKYFEDAEWVFNDFSDYYEAFDLPNTNQDEFESWLYSRFAPPLKIFELIPIKHLAPTLERRYELIQRNKPDRVHMRIATHPAGGRVLVFARGSEWPFRALVTGTGREVVIRYRFEFETFCKMMEREWHQPFSEDFKAEKEQFHDKHQIWKEMTECRTRRPIKYSLPINEIEQEGEQLLTTVVPKVTENQGITDNQIKDETITHKSNGYVTPINLPEAREVDPPQTTPSIDNTGQRPKTLTDLKKDSRLALGYLAFQQTSRTRHLTTRTPRKKLSDPKLFRVFGFDSYEAIRGAVKDYKALPPNRKLEIQKLAEKTPIPELVSNREN